MRLRMGLLQLFGKGPLSERQIGKIAKLAANPFAQPDVRMREMEKLLKDGSPEAMRGVLKRFASNASGPIADEDEKKFLENALVDKGDVAREPLREYIRGEKQLTYALRALRRIAGEGEAVAFFIDVLNDYGPDDHRGIEAKLQLVWQLSENLDDPRVMAALIPYLHDHSDDVRWVVLELLEKAADRKLLTDTALAQVAEALAAVVTDDASPRILQRTAELLSAREWQLPEAAEALNTLLDDEFFLDKKKFVRRRAKPTKQ